MWPDNGNASARHAHVHERYAQPPVWFFKWFAVEKARAKQVYILTADMNSSYVTATVTALNKCGVSTRICTASRHADFGLLMRSRTIVTSVSTFAWWAAFLGMHDREAIATSDDADHCVALKARVHVPLTGFMHPDSRYRYDSDVSLQGELVECYACPKMEPWKGTTKQCEDVLSDAIPEEFARKYRAANS